MNDMKIALYGQFESDTKFGFTFPDEFNPALNRPEDAWLRNVGDPRDAREFERAQRIYALWKSVEGNYYATIVPNVHDTRAGYIMLMLFVGRRVPTSGHDLITAMNVLEQKLIGEELRDRQAVAQLLQSLHCEFTKDNTLPTNNVVKSRLKAFRTYSNEAELADIFLYPNQMEYEQFNRVLLVPREAMTQMPINFQELNFPIRHTYNVECPQGVTANRFTTYDGDILEITYSRPTYADTTVQEPVQPAGSKHYIVSGPRLIVRSAEETGVQFVRRVRLDIRSAKTRQPLPVIFINGTRVNGTEVNISDGDEVNLTITAPGYRDETVKRPISAIIQAGYLISALLKPEEQDVSIMARCEGRMAEGHVSMSVDDPLYRYLTDKRNYEVHIERKPSTAAMTVTGSKGHQPATAKKDSSMIKMLIAALAGIIIGLILGLVVSYIFNSDKDDERPVMTVTEPDDDNSDDNADAQPTPKQREAQLQQEREEQERLEQADLTYLKRNDTWCMDSIHSVLYSGLYDMIVSANLEDINSHPYNTTDHPNGYWQQVVKNVNTILNSGNDTKINRCRDEFFRFTASGSCNLKKLNDALIVLINPQPGAPTNNRSSNGGSAASRQGGNANPHGNGSQGNADRSGTPSAPSTPAPADNGGRPRSH